MLLDFCTAAFGRGQAGDLQGMIGVVPKPDEDPVEDIPVSTLEKDDPVTQVVFGRDLRELEFLRFDCKTRRDVGSFSCRASGGGTDFMIMVSEKSSFTDGLVRWACNRHKLPILRDAKNPNYSQLWEFLNRGW